MNDTLTDELLTRVQTAALLGVTPRTIDRRAFRKRNRLKKIVLPVGQGRGGSRIRFLKSQVERAANKCNPSGMNESTWRNKAANGEIAGAVKKGKQWLLPVSVLRSRGIEVKSTEMQDDFADSAAE